MDYLRECCSHGELLQLRKLRTGALHVVAWSRAATTSCHVGFAAVISCTGTATVCLTGFSWWRASGATCGPSRPAASQRRWRRRCFCARARCRWKLAVVCLAASSGGLDRPSNSIKVLCTGGNGDKLAYAGAVGLPPE